MDYLQKVLSGVAKTSPIFLRWRGFLKIFFKVPFLEMQISMQVTTRSLYKGEIERCLRYEA